MVRFQALAEAEAEAEALAQDEDQDQDQAQMVNTTTHKQSDNVQKHGLQHSDVAGVNNSIFPSGYHIKPHHSIKSPIAQHALQSAVQSLDNQIQQSHNTDSQHDNCIQSIEQIVNDIKIIVQCIDPTVHRLCTQYIESYDEYSIQYNAFKLIQILYTTNARAYHDSTVDDRYAEMHHSFAVKHALSDWLSQYCSSALNESLQSIKLQHNNTLLHVICLLLCHRVRDACQVLSSDPDKYELLLLVSEIGESYSAQHDVELQLKQYQLDDSIQTMTKNEYIIYKLIAGDVASVAVTLARQYNLTWLNVFSLFLWYNKSAMYATLIDTMQTFTSLFHDDQQADIVVPRSVYSQQHNDDTTFDILYSIMAFYCNTDSALNEHLYKQIIHPKSYSLNSNDYHLAYHLHHTYTTLNSINASYDDNRIASGYCAQLEHIGLWHLAIYISAQNSLSNNTDSILHKHITKLKLAIDDELLNNLCVQVEVNQYSSSIRSNKQSDNDVDIGDDSSIRLVEFISDAAGITVERLYNMKAQVTLRNIDSTLQSHSQQYTYCQAYVQYLHAQNWDAAHQLFIDKIAAPLILTQKWAEIIVESNRVQPYIDDSTFEHGIGMYSLYKHTIDSIDVYMNDTLSVDITIDYDSINNMIVELRHIESRLMSVSQLHSTTNHIILSAHNSMIDHIIQRIVTLQNIMPSAAKLSIPDDCSNYNRMRLLDNYTDSLIHSV